MSDRKEENAELEKLQKAAQDRKSVADIHGIAVRFNKKAGFFMAGASVAVFTAAATTAADLLFLGGAMTATSIISTTFGILHGRDREKCLEECRKIEDQITEIKKADLMKDRPLTPPVMPAMLKLADAFNPDPAPENATPALQPKAKQPGQKNQPGA